MDLGVGDQVIPERKSLTLLSLNNKPLFESEISIQAYPLSSIFAEKLETIVYRGGINTRMKDFYDIALISELSEFDLKANQAVIRSVFANRKTILPTKLSYDTQALENLSQNWKRFLGTLEEEFRGVMPKEFSDVVSKISQLLKVIQREG